MKKQLVICGITLVLITIGLSGCTQEGSNNDVLSNLEYSNKDLGFGLNPPTGWEKTEIPEYRSVGFRGPEYPIGLSVTEIAESYQEPLTLSYVINQTLDGVRSLNVTNISLVSSRERTVNNMSAYEVVYSFMVNGSTLLLVQKQVYVEKNAKIFSLSYLATQSLYETYNTVVEESISSFTVI